MRISDWSSDVCSSDLDPSLDLVLPFPEHSVRGALRCRISRICACNHLKNCCRIGQAARHRPHMIEALDQREHAMSTNASPGGHDAGPARSEEHTSELQSLMRNSYAVFCLKTNKIQTNYYTNSNNNLTA